MIKNKTINAEEMGYVSPRAKVITLMMSHSLLQDMSDDYTDDAGEGNFNEITGEF